MKLLTFILFLSVSCLSAPRTQKPDWAPDNWQPYLESLYKEYLQRVSDGDQTLGPHFAQMQVTDFDDNRESFTPKFEAGNTWYWPEQDGVRPPLNEVQQLLKNNIVKDTLVSTQTFLEETLVPKTKYPWKTIVMPLERPTDANHQTARCLIQTIIDKPPIYSERYKVATLPVAAGARGAILRKLHLPLKTDAIQIYEFGDNYDFDEVFIQTANKIHIKIIHEILANVFPDYVMRRKWTKSFIRDLYFKAIARRMTTTYDIIREKSSGRLLATLGMDTVNYGAVKFFDKVQQRWRLSIGPMTALEHASLILNPNAASSFDFTKWNAPVELLGLEDDRILPRPLVEVARLRPTRIDPRLEKQMLRLLPADMNPDLSFGLVFYEGRIFEPTKLLVKKDQLRPLALDDIEADLADIFPICRDMLFHLWGQAGYTLNPEDIGVALYRRWGYPLSPSLLPKPVGEEMWPMQANHPGELPPPLFTLYKRTFEEVQKSRFSRCIDVLRAKRNILKDDRYLEKSE